MPRVLLLLALLLPVAATAQELFGAPGGAPPAEHPVVWSGAVEPGTAAAGETATLALNVEIDPGWRVYALEPATAGQELSVQVEAGAGIVPGALRVLEPREDYDAIFESDYTYLADRGRAEVPLRIAASAGAGSREVEASVRYTVCNDRLCLPPRTVPVSATLVVEPAAEPPAETEAEENAADAEDAEQATEADEPEADTLGRSTPSADTLAVVAPASGAPPAPSAVVTTPTESSPGAGGLLAFLLLAMGAGLAALLTPCVFPMIPLTVSYFTHQAGGRKRGVKMALVFGASIVVIFTGLGVLTAILVGAAGAQAIAASPWVNLFIGAVLIAFGFSMLGFFELRLPNRLLNYFNRQADTRGGYAGVLFMGTTLTLVSFSCTVPFVGGLLAATVRDEWAYPVLGMLIFSGVFALPFVAFALFPSALGRLPRSGAWMTALKATFGFVELAAALKFLSNADLVWGLGLLPRSLVVALAVVIFTLAGFYLLGALRLGEAAEERPARIGPWRLTGAMAFLGLALFFVPGLFGQSLGVFNAYLPPRSAAESAGLGAEAERVAWVEDREAAFAQARQTGQPVFIDFTGYTCTNCRYMEETVFAVPAIEERFAEDFVLLRLWTDAVGQAEELQAYQMELTGMIALPTYAIVTPQGDLAAVHSGIATTEEFASFLDAGRAAALGTDSFANR